MGVISIIDDRGAMSRASLSYLCNRHNRQDDAGYDIAQKRRNALRLFELWQKRTWHEPRVK